jgi:dipeptidyl aminopeptidase/acylaminoacyl peptidase
MSVFRMRSRLWTFLLSGALLALFAAAPARAQYFGQNKVRYENPPSMVLKTEHFDIYYSPEEADVVTGAATVAETWYAKLSQTLHHQLSSRQPLLLYASHSAFEQTNAVSGDLSEGVGGITESFKRRIVLPLGATRAETDHVIGHELVHAFQYDMAGHGHAIAQGANGIERLPLWFIEGMAEFYSVGPEDPNTAMWIRDAAIANKLPDYNQLADPRYFPYRWGQALWCYVAARFGENAVGRTLAAGAASGDPRVAFREALGVGIDTLITDWHAAIKKWSEPVAAATLPAVRQAQPLQRGREGAARLNVAPALSPDGSQVMFFSERSRFAIEMYLASASTGHVERQITKTIVDPHFSSLGFISSSGAWSPDGKLFAFGAVSNGRPVLSILDVQHKRIKREQRFKQLGEIYSPSWSPDGKRIVFSATADGITDLWIFDLARRKLARLTHDPEADLQPAWSPDGSSIAFVTDRFAAHPGAEDYRLALINPETGAITPVQGFQGAKHIEPAWSADGRNLFFVSDRHGISDIYRLTLASGEMRQITHLSTGVSGITALSPAFSLASGAGRLVFSTYEKGVYSLYRMDGDSLLAGEAPRAPAGLNAGRLPADSSVALPESSLAAMTTPAPPDTSTFKRAPYKARLSLDNAGQISLGVAGGANQVGVAGVLIFSDMMGNHTLLTALQVQNSGGNFINNTAFQIGYQDLSTRWNWGGQVSQIPYVTTSYAQDVAIGPGGQPVYRDLQYTYWQIDRSALVGTTYPFDRFRRLELSAGLRQIAFDAQLRTQLFDADGVPQGDVTTSLKDQIPATLNLGTTGIALVFDHSVFGGTGPVMGHRARFEVDPVIGSIHFTEVLVDYRKYVPLKRPVVLAGRVLQYGRYGTDAEDVRLSPLYLGYPSLVRGYDSGSFLPAEFAPGPNGSSVYDRLIGTKLAVANFEARLPLLGALGIIPSQGVPPVELAFFFDAGTAWVSGDKPDFMGGSAQTVTSMGTALRVNLFGFAIGEVDYVHPNDRPLKGSYWQFSFQPGF